MSHKPSICIDFDGVIHSYTSKWVAAYFIPDPPVSDAFEWLWKMTMDFEVFVHSSRFKEPGAELVTRAWFTHWHRVQFGEKDGDERCELLLKALKFSAEKPPALIYLDDRGMTFTGKFPTKEEIHKFKPWNK